MKIQRRHSFKLYPSSTQTVAMLDVLGACQRLYNTALEQRRFAFKERGVSLSLYDQQKEITLLKKAFPEYKAVHTHILQETLKRLHLAFQHFFRRVKNGETPGYPRFKPFQRYKGWDYKQYKKGWKIRLVEGPRASEKSVWIKLHGVGQMRMRGSVKVAGGVPKTCTIQRKAGGWYASIVFDYPKGLPEPEKKGTRAMGVDWGCEKLATLAAHDGGSTFIPNPRHLKMAEEKLKRVQRKLSRKKRGSKNRRKQARKVARAYRDVANQRKDGLHKATRRIVGLCALIAVEKLNVKGMTSSGGVYKRGLNRSILDTSPAELHNMLRYKAECAGSRYVEIPTRKVKPSQTCSCCGRQVKKALAERVHCCSECGFVCDRDVNAARVILSWALYEKPDGLPVPQGMGESTLVESAGCRPR